MKGPAQDNTSSLTTEQIKTWTGQFGKNYTERNPQSVDDIEKLYSEFFNISYRKVIQKYLGKLDRSIKILEAGCNVGSQLMLLQEMGFKNLYGIEIQPYAVEKSKKLNKNINIIQGNIFDIPFKDNYFDLVFTSGVLIHIHPKDIPQALKEIYRCSNKYIFGFEYYNDELEEITYRNNQKLAWKCNFVQLYMKQFKSLKLIKEELFKYVDDDNSDIMYLLEKK